MSMNLHLRASLDANTKLGKKKIYELFELYQTQTSITREAIASNNPFEYYKEWVLKISDDVQTPIYEENDFFEEREPIGFETENYGKNHIDRLNDWLNEHDGWEIEWFEM